MPVSMFEMKCMHSWAHQCSVGLSTALLAAGVRPYAAVLALWLASVALVCVLTALIYRHLRKAWLMTNVPECVYAMPGTMPPTLDSFTTNNRPDDKSATGVNGDASPPSVQSTTNNTFTVFRL